VTKIKYHDLDYSSLSKYCNLTKSSSKKVGDFDLGYDTSEGVKKKSVERGVM